MDILKVPVQETPNQQTLLLLKSMRLLEMQLAQMKHDMSYLMWQVHRNHGAASISAPERMKIRDEVCAYIETLKDFNPEVIYGGHESREGLLEFILTERLVGVEADSIALEFGVFKGKSLSIISRLFSGKVYGFDSFEGIPTTELIWDKGRFNNPQGIAYPLKPNTELVKGWFKDTMPDFVKAHDLSKVKLLHMDCDIYSSAKEIFEVVGPHLPKDVIIVFDEYWNYKGWKDGEFKAFHEFLAATGRTYTYLGYMDAGNQVAVKLH
ncbi:MAG: class I SAM-dependent methyltransferase [Alphaproteobacteria bacterium]|nr:class I SAM-dependent methyltransferase [Alphaproteobacteria bacterium]